MNLFLFTANEIKSAKNEGLIAKGVLEVVRAIETKKARIVVIAKDIELANLSKEVQILCNQHNIPFLVSLTRKEIGELVGVGVKTSFVAIIQPGLDRNRFYKFLSLILEKDFPDYCLVAKAKAKDEE